MKVTIHGQSTIVTSVNLDKTNPDFPNNWYQSQVPLSMLCGCSVI